MSHKSKYKIESFRNILNGESFFSHQNTFIKYNNDSARALTESMNALSFNNDPLYAAVFVMQNIASDDEDMKKLLMSNKGDANEDDHRRFINSLVSKKEAFILNTAYAMHLISNTSELYLNESDINEENSRKFFDEKLNELVGKVPGDYSLKLVKQFIEKSISKSKEEDDIFDWAESVSLYARNRTDRWVQENVNPNVEDDLSC